MEFSDNIYESICRVCLKYRDRENMVSLIDASSENGLSSFGEAVTTIANINIKQNECFPTNMCQQCLLMLKYAISFKNSCENSQKQLLKLLSLATNEIKEKVVEYTMFKQFFPQHCKEEESKHFSSVQKPGIIKDDIKSVQINQDKPIDSQDSSDSNDNGQIYYSGVENTKTEEDALLDRIEEIIDTPYGNVFSKNLNRPSKMLFRKQIMKNKSKLAKRNRQQAGLNCKICQKTLANQHTYDHHMQRHRGCRYICEHCGKGFPVLAELQIHQVTRHGTGPYLECQHCNFKAPRKFDLIEHERLHTGERPYACDKCGLTFRRRGIWKKHLIYHNEKKIQCVQCPRKFYQRSEMLAHMNNVHERVYVYLCNKCGATYAKGATVRRHLTERHGIPREMQGKILRIHKSKGNDFSEY